LIEIDPNNDRVYQQLIDLYYKQNKTSQANTALDQILSLYQRQDPPKALELLNSLVINYPEDMVLRQRLAIAYVQNGLTEDAIAAYDALGEMQLEQGLRLEAAQTIQAILNLNPSDPEGYQTLLAQIR
ncbi:MAG: tetratricopeptide repeat protein, partial [Chloroflexota bacterium]